MVVSILFTTPGAQSAERPIFYFGAAGGSQIRALGTTISSDLTGSSSVNGFVTPRSDSNRIAGVSAAGGAVKLGAISTWARASKAGAGTRILTGARTADVDLLGGLIHAKAVETNAVSVYRPSGTVQRAATEFLNLSIGGEKFPATVAKNTTISIPGVALVVLNGQQTAKVNGGVVTQGFGLYVRLLNNRGKLAAGAEILLNPTLSAVAPGNPHDVPQIGGIGYGTNVRARVGDLASLDVGPTAALVTPMVGTNGRTLRNTTASVDVPNVLQTGAVTSTTFGVTSKRRAYSTMTNQIADVNVLNQLVTADAIKVSSSAEKQSDWRRVHKKLAMTFVNLEILGQPVNVDVAPNTKLVVESGGLFSAPIAEVTINKRIRNKYGSAIIGVEVKLLRDRGALKTGAIVEIGVATTWIYS
jgi:hypothetical protein